MPENNKNRTLPQILDALTGKRPPKDYQDDKGLLSLLNRAPRPKAPQGDRITEDNIERFENETIEMASKAISVLEDALSKWDGLKEKPDELRPEFDNFRSFHKEIVQWERDILKSRANKEVLDFESRVDRLREYARICRTHR
ncbi:MAG: hypothetical protein AB1529_07750 [Candidatus Micrarchaeota archaeon]